MLKELGKVKCFLKEENYPKFKHPRGIFSRSDLFKTVFGPLCKAIEDQLYTLPEFIKHVPVENRGKYIYDYLGDEEGEFLATDYTAYESHFIQIIMRNIDRLLFEHMLSRHGKSQYYLWLFDKFIMGKNYCKFRYIMAEIIATRMSGEMNTSMSNGFANLMLTKYVFHTKGVRDIKTVVEGDDGLTRCPPGIKITEEDYRKLGFTIKLERFSKLNEASFCGLIFDPVTLDVVADPMKFLLNFFYTRGKYVGCKESNLRGLLKSKAMSAIVQYPNAPVISAIAQYAYRVTRKFAHKVANITAEDRYKAQTLLRFKKITPKVTMESRYLVEKIFKFPIDLQVKLENYFNDKNDFLPWTDDDVYALCHDDTKIFFENYGNYYRDGRDAHIGNLFPKNFPIKHTIAVNIKFDGKKRKYKKTQ